MNLEQQLIQRLQSLSPIHLEVVNESSGHGGYFPGKESHFKVVVVSDAFEGLRLVQRIKKFMLPQATYLVWGVFMLWQFMLLLLRNGKVKRLLALNVPMHLNHNKEC